MVMMMVVVVHVHVHMHGTATWVSGVDPGLRCRLQPSKPWPTIASASASACAHWARSRGGRTAQPRRGRPHRCWR
jgi:hypothetical protein